MGGWAYLLDPAVQEPDVVACAGESFALELDDAALQVLDVLLQGGFLGVESDGVLPLSDDVLLHLHGERFSTTHLPDCGFGNIILLGQLRPQLKKLTVHTCCIAH